MSERVANVWSKSPPGLSDAGAGWYWMRHRFRYRRIWTYDVVWVADSLWRKDGGLRHPIKGWVTVGKFRHVSFAGPIQPPAE